MSKNSQKNYTHTKELEVPKEIVEVGGDGQDDDDEDGDAEKDPDPEGGDGEAEPEGKIYWIMFTKFNLTMEIHF